MASKSEQFKIDAADPNLVAMRRPGGGISFIPTAQRRAAIDQNYLEAGEIDMQNAMQSLLGEEEDKDDVSIFERDANDPKLIGVIRPDNGFSFIPRTDEAWGEALSKNYRQATQEEIAKQRDQIDYSDTGSSIIAGIAGASRGATFGLSDVATAGIKALVEGQMSALSGEGFVPAFKKGYKSAGETLGKYEEYNPNLSLGTEVAGAVLPALLSGGASLTVSGGSLASKIGIGGAKVLASPSAATAIIARQAERQLIKKLGGGALAKVGARAAGGAGEGLLYGAGQIPSRLTIDQDAELNSELVLGTLGVGTVAGLVGGGIFGTAEAGLGAVAKRMSKANQAFDEVGGLAGNNESRLKDIYSRFASWRSGADAEDIADLFNQVDVDTFTIERLLKVSTKEAGNIQSSASRITNKHYTKLLDDFADTLGNNMDSVSDVHSSLRKHLDDPIFEEVLDRTVNVEAATTSALDMHRLMDRVIVELEKNPAKYSNKSAINKVKQIRTALGNDFIEVARTGKPSKAFRSIASASDLLDSVLHPEKTVSKANKETIDLLRARLDDPFQELMNSDVAFGQLGQFYGSLKSAYSKHEKAMAKIHKMFGSRVGDKSVIDSKKLRDFFLRPSSSVNAEKLKNVKDLYKSIAGLSDLGKQFKALDNILPTNSQDFDKRIFDLFMGDVKNRVDMNAIINLIESRSLYDRVAKIAGTKSGAIDAFTAISGMFAFKPGFGMGELGLVAAQFGKRPHFEAALINKVLKSTSGATSKVSKAIKSLGKLSPVAISSEHSGAAHGLAMASTALALEKYRLTDKRRKKGQDYLSLVEEEINALASDPESMIRTMQKNTEMMSEMFPDMQKAISQRAVKAIQILKAALPKRTQLDPLDPTSLTRASDYELAKFKRIYKAVMDPLSVVEELGNGTSNRDGMEVLKELYPNIYGLVTTELIQLIQSKKVPYQTRLKIGNILGVKQENTQRLQSIYAPAEQPQKQGGGKKKKSRKVSEGSNKRMFQAQQSQAEKTTFS